MEKIRQVNTSGKRFEVEVDMLFRQINNSIFDRLFDE